MHAISVRLSVLSILVLTLPLMAQDHLGLTLTGRVQGSCEALAINGTHAYISSAEAFQSVDISDPTHPRVVGRWNAPSGIWAIVSAGNYAYVGLRDRGVKVLDVSDPARPQLVATVDTPPYIRDMRLDNNRLYLAIDREGFGVIDITDPVHAHLLFTDPIIGYGYGIAPVGDVVYTASYTGGFQALSSNQDQNWNVIDSMRFGNVTYSVDVANGYAFVGSSYDVGLRVVDVSDPANLREVGHNTALQGGILYSIAAQQSHVAVGWVDSQNQQFDGAQIFDASDPTRPVRVGYYLQPRCYKLVWEGRYIYTSGDYFSILDASAFSAAPAIGIAEADQAHDFGQVLLGSNAAWDFQIRNIGFPNLVIGNITTGNPAFTVGTNQRYWDQRRTIPVGDLAHDQRLSGVEFDGEHFFVSGGVNGAQENKIYEFSADGQLTGSFFQFAESVWGMRDLAWDGQLLWGADGQTVYGFTRAGDLVTSFAGPLNPSRAMTWDESRQLLWVGDATSDLIGIDREGNEVARVERSWNASVYGLATWLDDPDGHILYLFATTDHDQIVVIKVDPNTGDAQNDTTLHGAANDFAAGATITSELQPPATMFVGLVDGDADYLGIWQITNHYLGGDLAIVPEDSIAMMVQFAPTDSGEYNDTLTITSNDPADGQFQIALHGTAIAGEAPQWGGMPRRIVGEPGAEIAFDLQGRDADGQPVRIRELNRDLPYAARVIDYGNGSGRFDWTPPAGSEGEYDLQLALTDGVHSTAAEFVIEVNSTMSIPLRQGWSLLSSYYSPSSPDIPTVWGAIISRSHLSITKNDLGQFCVPDIGFSNMDNWDVRRGYWARLTAPDTLVIRGNPVAVDTPIPLRTGWNLCAYFPAQRLSAEVAFANLGDDLIMVKDDNGRFYNLEARFANMGLLERGKGYQIDVRHAVDLIYPTGNGRMRGDGSTEPLLATSHFAPHAPTSASMSLLFTTTKISNAQNMELGVFTQGGQCVGASSLPASGTDLRFGVAVWGDDPTTSEIEGAGEGEALTFKIWDGKIETPIAIEWQKGKGAYETDGFATATLDLGRIGIGQPNSFALDGPYPNPFNAAATIRFSLREAGTARLSLYELSGRRISTLAEGEFTAGSHTLTLNATQIPTGVYVLSLTGAEGTRSVKAVILK